jgi:hypothetical protein
MVVVAIARIRRRSRWRDPSLWKFRSPTLLDLRRTNVRPSSTRLTAISALAKISTRVTTTTLSVSGLRPASTLSGTEAGRYCEDMSIPSRSQTAKTSSKIEPGMVNGSVADTSDR